MRWSNLSMNAEERARLPGYREDAVVRHFDAPEAVETRFYEVRARSILNRVPEASQVPFRWTINPFRGCTHSCVYCIDPNTPVLMGDGRHRPMAELDVGDIIYGTEVSASGYRRYVRTTVLDKWITIKHAYRVTLEDGTELITSGDHRLLSNRGWKHVAKSERGLRHRPHLRPNNRLVGTGQFAPQPVHDADYRRGYLCGLIRGHGTSGAQDRSPGTGRRVRQRAAGAGGGVVATHAQAGSSLERISQLIAWPLMPSLQWCRGFLAGIFDTEGSWSDDGLRIASSDPQSLVWIEACARRLGFDTAVDRANNVGGLACVRIRGGLSEHLRFFHVTDPAITRKRDIEGQMVKTSAKLRVAEIEPLGGPLPLYDITTGTGDFIANGVVSHNCFARPTHKYLEFDAGRDFEREIVVKVNAPELLRVELARPSWKGEHVALGTNTDPYQWAEGRYKLMPGIWEAMRDAANPCSVLTKSPLLLRDLPLMTEINRRTEFSAALSVPTVDEKAWRSTEPRSPNPRARLEAVAELTRAGIRTGVLVAPLMPGINDAPEQIAPILEMASEAGAAYVTGIALHLRGDVKQLFLEWLGEHRPDLVERYKRLYRRGAYAHPDERRRLTQLVTRTPGPEGRLMRGRNTGSGARETPDVAAKSTSNWTLEQGRLF